MSEEEAATLARSSRPNGQTYFETMLANRANATQSAPKPKIRCTMCTEDAILAVEWSIEEDPKESFRHIAQQHELCPSNVRRLLRKDLGLRAYKFELVERAVRSGWPSIVISTSSSFVQQRSSEYICIIGALQPLNWLSFFYNFCFASCHGLYCKPPKDFCEELFYFISEIHAEGLTFSSMMLVETGLRPWHFRC